MDAFDIDTITESRQIFHTVDVGFDVKPGTDLKTPVGFVLVGTNSEEYAIADREVRAFNIKASYQRAKDQTKALDPTTDEGALDVATATESHRAIYLKHCVVGWYGFKQAGELATFSSGAAMNVLKARPQWAIKLIAAIETEANFIKG